MTGIKRRFDSVEGRQATQGRYDQTRDNMIAMQRTKPYTPRSPDEANEGCRASSVASRSCCLAFGHTDLGLPDVLPLNRNGVLCQSSTVPVALVWLIKSRPQ